MQMALIDVYGGGGRKVETGGQHQVTIGNSDQHLTWQKESVYSPQNEDASTMIVALSFNVGVGHQEHREDKRNDVPAWEDQAAKFYSVLFHQKTGIGIREGLGHFAHVGGVIPSREGHHGRNLEETDLQGVSRSNFHTAQWSAPRHAQEFLDLPQGDVPIDGERNGVHELCSVGHERE